MPKYKVTDSTSGHALILEGDAPPTEDELNQVFASYKQPQPQQVGQPRALLQQQMAQARQEGKQADIGLALAGLGSNKVTDWSQRPLVEIPKITPSPDAGWAKAGLAGTANTITGFAGGMTSPLNLATLPAFAESAAASNLAKFAKWVLGTEMARNALTEGASNLGTIRGDPNASKVSKVEAVLGPLADLYVAGGLGHVKEPVKARLTPADLASPPVERAANPSEIKPSPVQAVEVDPQSPFAKGKVMTGKSPLTPNDTKPALDIASATDQATEEFRHDFKSLATVLKGYQQTGDLTPEQIALFEKRGSAVFNEALQTGDMVKARQVLSQLNQEVTDLAYKKENQNATLQTTQQSDAGGQQGSQVQEGQVLGASGQTQSVLPADVSKGPGGSRPSDGPSAQGVLGHVQTLDKTEQAEEQRRLAGLFGGEEGFHILPPNIFKRIGFQGSTKIDPAQMLNRLKNTLGETSATFEWLKNAGLGSFLSQPRSAEELRQWAEANSPKAEVHSYGMEGKVSEAKKKMADLTHEFETRGYVVDTTRVGGVRLRDQRGNELTGDKLPADLQPKWQEYADAALGVQGEPSDAGGPRATSAYSSVSALPTDEPMPDWTATKSGKNVQRVDVVIPKSTDASLREAALAGRKQVKVGELWQPDNLHENLPNTLGWAMIQYKTGPKGEKIAVIAEAQSRWAQVLRDQKSDLERIQRETEAETGRRMTDTEMATEYRIAQNHPLLRDYNRLILKAAIEQARKEGATHIMVSDAETAMMTEGHDASAAHPQRLSQIQGKAPVIPQEPGMRLNYDTILPKIAEELTGNKGERVSLGEHKNAMDTVTGGREGGGTQQYTKPRSNLIFRNADGTPKTDVSGQMFEIGKRNPEPQFSYFGKDKGEAGFVINPFSKGRPGRSRALFGGETGFVINPVQTDIIDSIKEHFDKGKDLISSVLDGPVKAGVLGFQRYSYPQLEARSPETANVLAQFANAHTAAELRARVNLTKVFGDKLKDEQFLKQFGGLLYEDMRRAAGNEGSNPVFKLHNTPFANEVQYNAFKARPDVQETLARWKSLVQDPAEAMHKELGGQLSATGEETGGFMNLKAVFRDPVTGEEKPSSTGQALSKGPLATVKKGSAFSKERKFTGEEYNLNAADAAVRMLTRNAYEIKKRGVYEALEKAGLGKIIDNKSETPKGMNVLANPVRVLTVLTDKGPMTKNQFLAINPKVESEVSQAFQVNTSCLAKLEKHTPAVNHAIQTVIKVQTALGIDLGVHSVNDVVATMFSPKESWTKALTSVIRTPIELASVRSELKKAGQDLSSNPAIIEELAKMAEQGVSFRGSQPGWAAESLRLTDTATRLFLNREFDARVKKGGVLDTPAERRRYISGRAGEYNKRMMGYFQQQLQETGLSPFVVAGKTFNRLSIGNLIASPGVKGANTVEALRLRLATALGVASALLVLPSTINTISTGSPTANDKVKPWQVYLGTAKDGNAWAMDMTKSTLFARGGRATGVDKVMEQQVMPRLQGEQPASWKQTLREAGMEALKTKVAPYVGPPLNVAGTLLTGKTPLGFEQRSPGEQGPPYIEAAGGALNPLAGPATGYGYEGSKGKSIPARLATKLGGIVGIKELPSPKQIIGNLRRQYLYKLGKGPQADFAPSEYKTLINELESGVTDNAKDVYTKLIEEKVKKHSNAADPVAEAKKDLEVYFNKYAKGHAGLATKEDEEAFVKQLTPHQQDLYAKMLDKQKEVAEAFFALQPKTPKNQNAFGSFGFKGFGKTK